MNWLFELIAIGTKLAFGSLVDWAKVEVATFYIAVVDRFRQFFNLGLAAAFALVLALTGFLMVHIGLFFLLPWAEETKAIILLVLGGVYLIIPTLLIAKISSRRQWMKASGAEAMLDEISKNKS